MTNTKIFRFKISNPALYDAMIDFASLHKFEDKTTLKKNYQTWVEDSIIAELITKEEEFLKSQEYDLEKNNIKKKMFKSIKYYHIKNMLKSMEGDTAKLNDKSMEPNEKNVRKKNIVFSKILLQHVKDFMQENINKDDFKPSVYYALFLDSHQDCIEREKAALFMNITEKQEKEPNEFDKTFDFRLKKMFKNQYFNMFKLQN